MNRWQLHVAEWKDCTRCELSETRKTVCVARGTMPCDVAFVGEAPGTVEDVNGQAFTGPAGKLLQRIVRDAFADTQVEGTEGPAYNSRTWAFTNLVGCIPKVGGEKGQPDHEHVMACKPRLEAELDMLRPRVVVAVGKLAATYLSPGYKHSVRLPAGILEVVEILHPSFILSRVAPPARPLKVKQCVITIRDAVEKL